ncbi:hypothetical protein H4R99_005087 [Coemansia sp. RSA 1722]|nr:hypothetical protein IWW45_001096 [Coemansia sp. RSA 485]KAJ2596051.1 hypothetical protein H4R99_005087 [Coemansia sp. RSA 1722]
MCALSPLQTLPQHIVESIMQYALNTTDRFAHLDPGPAEFFLRSCRVFRQAYLKRMCSTAYINKTGCRFTETESTDPFDYLQPPVLWYPDLVKKVKVDFWKREKSLEYVCEAGKQLASGEYATMSFDAARVLTVAVHITDGYRDGRSGDEESDESEEPDESNIDESAESDISYTSTATDGVDRSRHDPRYISNIKDISQIIMRVREMVPNIHTVQLYCRVYAEADWTLENQQGLRTLVADLLCNIPCVVYREYGRLDDTPARLDPGLFANLTRFAYSNNRDQGWKLEIVRRNCLTLQQLSVKGLGSSQVDGFLRTGTAQMLVYPQLKELELEWQGCYKASDTDNVIYFPVLQKLTVSNCLPILCKPFFNSFATLGYLDISVYDTGDDPLLRFKGLDNCRLDNLKMLRINCGVVHLQHIHMADPLLVRETQLIQTLFSLAPGLRTLCYSLPFGQHSCQHLHDVLNVFIPPNLTRINLGMSKLSLSNFILLLQNAPMLISLEFSPKSEKFDLKQILISAQKQKLLNNSVVKIDVNHVHLYQNVGCLVATVFTLVVACPRFSKLSVYSSLPYDHVKTVLLGQAAKQPYKAYKDVIKSVCARMSSFDLKQMYFG